MVIYPTRYKAQKAKTSANDIVVKVVGGYTVMTACQYQVWRKQK